MSSTCLKWLYNSSSIVGIVDSWAIWMVGTEKESSKYIFLKMIFSKFLITKVEANTSFVVLDFGIYMSLSRCLLVTPIS